MSSLPRISIVNETYSAGLVFRKVFLLAAIGFAAILLSGPILAVVSVLLSVGGVIAAFALVGFLIWLPFRMLMVGPERALVNARDMGAGVMHDVGRVARRGASIVSWPLWLTRSALIALLAAGWFTLRATFTTARFALSLTFLVAMGAGLGAVLGIGAGLSQGHDVGPSVLANALAGAAIALVCGVVMAFPRRQVAHIPTQAAI